MPSTKEKLVLSSISLISKKGIQALSLKNLFEHSKISKSLINYYYPKLEHILVDAFEEVSSKGVSITENFLTFADSKPENQLTSIVSAAFYWHLKHHEYGRFFVLSYHLGGSNKRLANSHKRAFEIGVKRIVDTLPKNAQSKRAAHSIHGLVVGQLLKMIASKDESNWSKYMDEIDWAIKILTGIKTSSTNLLDKALETNS